MATAQQIGDWAAAHTRAVMDESLESVAADPFKSYVNAVVAALPKPLRRVDVKHVWRSGGEWHVHAEVVGDEEARMLLLRYLDAESPQLLGGGLRSLG